MKKAFTLIELLVVISIISLLTGILLPVMGQARLQAKILAVNTELRLIGTALEAYSFDNEGSYPPTRVDCSIGEHFYQLPVELVDNKYLPSPESDSHMAAGMEDRFNRGYTYKYRSVGTLIYNRTTIMENGSSLWVPERFPDADIQDGNFYDNLEVSPVSWILYSQGPEFDLERMRELSYPVPRETWYDSQTSTGIIVRMRLQNGNQIGSFEN
ncbi:type II secretion system protein [Planctomycetota bacterium]